MMNSGKLLSSLQKHILYISIYTTYIQYIQHTDNKRFFVHPSLCLSSPLGKDRPLRNHIATTSRQSGTVDKCLFAYAKSQAWLYRIFPDLSETQGSQ